MAGERAGLLRDLRAVLRGEPTADRREGSLVLQEDGILPLGGGWRERDLAVVVEQCPGAVMTVVLVVTDVNCEALWSCCCWLDIRQHHPTAGHRECGSQSQQPGTH